jgi:hypothetical protein
MHATPNSKSLNLVASPIADLPLSLLKSGQLLCLTPDCRGSLLVQKEFYADYIGAGGAVGGCFDVDSKAVYVLGTVEFFAPQTDRDRAAAFRKRIAYSKTLEAIAREPLPLRRVQTILRFLSQRFGPSEVAKIPHELIAQLVGVQANTVSLFWQHHQSKRFRPKGKRESKTANFTIIST